jgi:hypothetical protein
MLQDYMNKLYYELFIPHYEGEGAEGGTPEGGSPEGGSPEGSGESPDNSRLMGAGEQIKTPEQAQQELLSEMVKASTAELETKYSKLQTDYNALMKQSEMIKNSREQAEDTVQTNQQQLSDLQAQLSTAKETYDREMDTLKNTYDSKITELSSSADSWKNRFVDTLIDNEVRRAASQHDAVSDIILSKSIREFISPVENEDGSIQIQMRVQNNDGQVTPLSINEGVNYIKDNPKKYPEYQGLFRINGSGGMNKNNAEHAGGGPSLTDVAKTGDVEAYRRHRQQHLNK